MNTTPMTATEQRAYVRDFAVQIAGNFIDGCWRASASADTIEVFDPSTGERLGEVASSSAKDVDAAVTSARAAQKAWAAATPAERSQALFKIADSVEARVGLATLYKSQGREADVRTVLADLVGRTPNPSADTYRFTKQDREVDVTRADGSE